MKQRIAIAWMMVIGWIIGWLYDARLVWEGLGALGLFVVTAWALNVLETVPSATPECGDAKETGGARNIKNDADEGEAARKEE